MANKPLKSIKFPGLSDVYTIDSGLSDAVKEALLACFRNVAWTTEEGQNLYNTLYNAFYPDARIASLSAVFTQGSRVITPTDSLDSLKQNLIVTATYYNGTTATITDYVLSGELTAGTSVITVIYGGKTATFEVTVELPSAIYTLSNRNFNGTSDYVDTGIQLLKTDSAFTIFLDFTAQNYSSDSAIIHCVNEVNPWPGFFLGERTYSDGNRYFRHAYYSYGQPTYFNSFNTNRHKYLIVHEAGSSNSAKWYFDNDNGSTDFGYVNEYTNINQNLLIGCYQDTNGNRGRYWNGVMHEFKIWDSALNTDDIAHLMGGNS
jgi:hypothetical protein